MGRLNKLFRRLQVNPNWLNWINRAVAHPTLGNRPVPASPYPRESQSFASHANTHRVIPPLQPVSLPRFSSESFFLTRFACPLCPPCLVREFSWLAELMAFGKIASSTLRTGLSERPCSHKKTLRVFSVCQPFPSLLLWYRRGRSLLRIASTALHHEHIDVVRLYRDSRPRLFQESIVRCACRPDHVNADHEESSAPRASFACTRDVLTHVVLLCPVSHVNLRPRAAEGRDRVVERRNRRQSERQRGGVGEPREAYVKS